MYFCTFEVKVKNQAIMTSLTSIFNERYLSHHWVTLPDDWRRVSRKVASLNILPHDLKTYIL